MEVYKEANLPTSFASTIHAQIRNWVEEGQSFSIIGMTASGVSPLLKFVASQEYAYFIHLDLYELETFTKESFIVLLWLKLTGERKKQITFTECKDQIYRLLEKQERIVLIINKFDLLSHEFTQSFLGNFRTLCHGTDGKLSIIFSVTKPYIEYNEGAIAGSNMHIFSRYLYFRGYEINDLKALIRLHSPEFVHENRLSQAIDLCGGHIQLLQLILRSEMPNNLQMDPYIKLLFKSILEPLTVEKRKIVQKIAHGKKTTVDPFLIHIGMLREDETLQLFSPLLQRYLTETTKHRLATKEKKLFRFLQSSKGKIVSKDELFEAVWEENYDNASDWALDSLIYRLRKHPALRDSGYEIINHKKQGYQLIKN